MLRCKQHCDSLTIAQAVGAATEDVLPSPDDRPPEYSDDALALAFTAEYGAAYRFTAERGQWSRWTGTVWRADITLAVFDQVRLVLRRIAADCIAGAEGDKKRLRGARAIASSITSARTVSAVEKLARSDRVHAATADQWDADPWLLNTPGGLIDLRTAHCRPCTAEDYCTRQTAVAVGIERPKRWLAFLARVTGGDADLQAFLQRLAGYSLTGSTRAQAMFFLYGTGGNGKGTFLETLSHLLADYQRTAPIDTFTASRFDRHSTELAMLRGARLVTAQETDEGRRWAESKIKALTGGDPISAHFMRQDHFTFTPQFKLVIAGNHKPQLRNVDEAMRRRFHLVPFTVTIGATERIEGLAELLRAELSDILGWALDGCIAWQHEGLNPPASVHAATEEYFEGEDSFQAWLDECCVLQPGQTATSAALFHSWRQWADAAGESAGSSKSFAQTLTSRGFIALRIGRAQARGFGGVQLAHITAVGARSRDVA